MTVTNTKPVTKRPRKMARMPQLDSVKPDDGTAAAMKDEQIDAKPQSKSVLVLEILQRQEGATLAQMVAATGWLPHTTRAALTMLKKKGHVVTSEKLEGQNRVYRIAAQ